MNRLWTRAAVYAALVVILFSQRPAGVEAGAAEAVRQRFLGTWRLVVDENISKDGKVTYPDFGAHAVGYLMYASDGHMCAGLMNPDRPQWKEPRAPTEKEKIRLFDSFYAYCGRFEINEAEHVMMHLPELASTPDFVNSRQARPYSFEGNRVTFSGPDPTPQGGTYRIVWEKVK
jgi:hypothetical protein